MKQQRKTQSRRPIGELHATKCISLSLSKSSSHIRTIWTFWRFDDHVIVENCFQCEYFKRRKGQLSLTPKCPILAKAPKYKKSKHQNKKDVRRKIDGAKGGAGERRTLLRKCRILSATARRETIPICAIVISVGAVSRHGMQMKLTNKFAASLWSTNYLHDF